MTRQTLRGPERTLNFQFSGQVGVGLGSCTWILEFTYLGKFMQLEC